MRNIKTYDYCKQNFFFIFLSPNIVIRKVKLEDQITHRLLWSIMGKWLCQAEVSETEQISGWQHIHMLKVLTTQTETQEHTLQHRTRLHGPTYISSMLCLIAGFLARERWITHGKWEQNNAKLCRAWGHIMGTRPLFRHKLISREITLKEPKFPLQNFNYLIII